MKLKQENHIIDILFVIALFCIFALSAIFLISIGANIYGKTVDHMESNFNGRTSFAYITEKIRQSDKAGSISVGELDGIPALLITESQGETQYVTYIYEYEGHLKELMVRRDTPLDPFAGQDIMEVNGFELTQIKDNLYSFNISTNEEETYHLYVNTKSTGGNADEQ